MSGVRVTDQGADAFVARMKAIGQRRVRVGVLADAPKRGGAGGAGGASLLEVAANHEFGAPSANIPQRSYVRATVDLRRSEIDALQEQLAARVAKGELDEGAALEQLGAAVAGMIQARIAEGIDPPLAPETVERKGSSTPLIDTGQLRSSITWAVV